VTVPRPPDMGMGRCPDCGKVRYASRREARQAAQGLRWHGGNRKRARTYRCGNYWHLTTQDAEKAAWYREHMR